MVKSEYVKPFNALSTYNDKNEEIPDARPVALHVKFERPIPLGERMQALIRSELLARDAEAQGLETFDEADDFVVGEDELPGTPYEDDFDPGNPGVIARHQEIKAGQVEDVSEKRIAEAKALIAKAAALARTKLAKDKVADEPLKAKPVKGEEMDG